MASAGIGGRLESTLGKYCMLTTKNMKYADGVALVQHLKQGLKTSQFIHQNIIVVVHRRQEMKLSEVKVDRRILVQGRGGTGKTTIIGTLCKLLPTLVVTCDANGLDTLRHMGVDPEVVLMHDWKNCWDDFKKIAEASSRCRAVAIDDFGSVQTTARRKIEQMPRGWDEEHAKNLGPAVKQQLMRGERRMQMQDWGGMWVAMETFLYEVLALPYAVKLVTVLEAPDKDPRTGEMRLFPQLQGAIQNTLSPRFSLVAESFIAEHDDKTYYCLSCRSHPKIETKTRFSEAGRTWVNPDMTRVLAYCGGKGGVESKLESDIGIGIE